MRSRWGVLAAASFIVVLAGCATDSGTATTAGQHKSSVSAVTVTVTASSPTATVTTTAPPQTPTVAPVNEGAQCSPIGATALFTDGSTAYCSRLAGTDAAVWSSVQGVAPNPNLPQTATSGPSLGDQCIGADIGRTTVDANGNAVICTNYQWQLNTGQTPEHRWADDQRAWSDCIQTKTTEECRAELNSGG
ncbi:MULTISPECIES: hypothetical protein [Gordonia]|uniref:hypothetical protein n=1 Tax=Gordonia TaxID=2053 RepID=UPI00257F96E3|nr:MULTISPECIES: hypothetical protein [Gordonia]